MENVSLLDWTSLVSSIVSLIVGIVAIWLSVTFYRMSSKMSEATREAAKGIAASVERLEKLFDRLYSDTFAMMKETVTDMRKHIWPEVATAEDTVSAEAERKAEERIEELKGEVRQEIGAIVERAGVTNARIRGLERELREVMDRAIVRSRVAEVEARDETLRNKIRATFMVLRRGHRTVSAGELVERMADEYPGTVIVRELTSMRERGVLAWEGLLEPDTQIELP